ncbi:hypothetical protein IM816_16100 [Luteibacter flocculans]|uniref:BIG2 domain-containing protein n=1 Tax=Luteibacter flocculans TaxID=2780091 RepID=A0ABY4T0K6_9GAMM|nr:Ig-like domain-containing protein [Luteibacter flocculans]URL58101.1 hypothetical protein IM816_16100 [Luteibacter flocculans]
MKRFVGFFFVILLSACAVPVSTERSVIVPYDDAPQVTASQPRPTGKQGADAAAELTRWYNDKVSDCGNPGLAAALCSGVMVRATENNPAVLPWDPSNASIISGGVSFSWLRADSNFSNLVYGYRNGFIFYPVLRTPPGKNSNIEVLCVFPHDAGSNDRPSLQGCGPTQAYPADSRPCTDQGINTAAEWLKKYDNSANPYHFQCGWSVRSGERDQAARFMAAVGTRRAMANKLWVTQNELRLATWATGTGATLPIQSFFYVDGYLDARAKAQNDQLRYFQHYGQTIPVIRLTLAAARGGRASFAYFEEDQIDSGSGPVDMQFDTRPVYLDGEAFIITQRPDILPRFDGSNSITRTAFGGRPPYTYTSSNTAVAVVSSTGKVTPRANGTAIISVKDSAGQRAEYQVTMTNVLQVRYAGNMPYQTALDDLASRGERMPISGDIGNMQLVFGSRWPYVADYYWASDPCGDVGHGMFYIHVLERNGKCRPATQAGETVGLK